MRPRIIMLNGRWTILGYQTFSHSVLRSDNFVDAMRWCINREL